MNSAGGATPATGLTANELQKLVVGGSEYGHHTLTRFFALHAGVLPALLVLVLALHLALFRKHGVTHPGDWLRLVGLELEAGEDERIFPVVCFGALARAQAQHLEPRGRH